MRGLFGARGKAAPGGHPSEATAGEGEGSGAAQDAGTRSHDSRLSPSSQDSGTRSPRRFGRLNISSRMPSFWRRRGGRGGADEESEALTHAEPDTAGARLVSKPSMAYVRRKANLASRNARWAPCWRCAPSLLEDDEGQRHGQTLKPSKTSGTSNSGFESVRICTLPSSFGARTVHEDDAEFYSQKIPFQARCALVLAVAGQGKDWHKSWLLGREDNKNFKANLFKKIDGSRVADGNISWDEFDSYCTENPEEIEAAPSRFHGMLNHDVREKAFQKFDVDSNNTLTQDEFDLFVCNLDREYFKYRLRAELVTFRAYWGRGLITPGANKEIMDNSDAIEFLRRLVYAHGTQYGDTPDMPETPDSSSHMIRSFTSDQIARAGTSIWTRMFICGRDEDRPLKFGILAPGWWEDFKYYVANNHALLGIFMCDRYHPLDWRERLMMEASTWCWSWLALCFFEQYYNIFHHYGRHSGVIDRFLFSLLFGTLPGVLWWFFLFSLYAQPCTNTDETRQSVANIQRIRCVRRGIEVTAHMIVIMTLCLPFLLSLLYGMKTLIDEDRHEAKNQLGAAESVVEVVRVPHIAVVMYVIFGRLKGYALTWLGTLLFMFNPVVTIGDPQTDFSDLWNRSLYPQFILHKLVEKFGVGRWRLQKLRFTWLCAHGLHQLELDRLSLASRVGDSDGASPRKGCPDD